MMENVLQPVLGPRGMSSYELHESLIRVVSVEFTAAQVIASNTTPLVLMANSDTSKVLVYHDAIVQIFGGSANYDQNQDFIVKYQTAGGGATVSTTLANFMNAGAANKLSTLKQLTTDAVPEAGQDLVLTSSASPYAAAGDRQLRVTLYYSVFTLST